MKEAAFDLSLRNGYRVQARAKHGVVPFGEDALIGALRAHPQARLIGAGYNIILSKSRYDESFIVVSLPAHMQTGAQFAGRRLRAYAGTSMLDLSIAAQRLGLSGLEMFYDIPSSLGGAVVMNAGANGLEICELLVSVRAFDRSTGDILELRAGDLDYGYRRSLFQARPSLVVLSAELELRQGDPDEVRVTMERIKETRWRKQPRDLPNAGSVFKRPPGRFVGQMLDELELRGLTIGGAQISTKHSGFIVNLGGATGADILALIEEVRKRVYAHFQIDLVREQVII